MNHTMSANDSEYPNSQEKFKDQDSVTQNVYADDGLLKNSTTKSIGIRKIEFLNSQYSSPYLKICLFVSIFFVSYCYSLDGTLRSQFQGYATNDYAQHSLLATVNVIRSVVAAAAQPTYARLSDRFGRLELLIVSILFYVVGTILESQAFDINRFAGGAVLYQIGYSGVIVLIQIILADFSTLEFRLFCSFIPALPFIINTWVSGDVMASLLSAHSWSYNIAIWAFIFPLSCIPLLACFVHMLWLARRTKEWKVLQEEAKTGKKWLTLDLHNNMVVGLFWELDVVGILFIICVFGFILVPFTIAGGTNSTWAKASTIVPLVIGFVLIPFFILWEGKYAKFPVMPLQLMKDRGVWSALIIAMLINFIWYMPNDYMYPVLLVGMGASVKAATRISSLYSFVSVIVGPLLGLFIVYNQYFFGFFGHLIFKKLGFSGISEIKRLKGFIIFGCFCWMGSLGILLRYRGGNDGTDREMILNGVIGGLCFMGFGAGFFTYPTQVSISTCTNHEYMAVVISLYLASYNIGSALGSSVSGAIWTNRMYQEIVKQMTARGFDESLAALAYGSPYDFIAEYVWGTPQRIAVVNAYAVVQRIVCIVGLCLCVPLIFFSLFLRNHKLEKVQSLEFDHDPEAGIKDNSGQVVVNDYDEDIIVKSLKRFFSKKKN